MKFVRNVIIAFVSITFPVLSNVSAREKGSILHNDKMFFILLLLAVVTIAAFFYIVHRGFKSFKSQEEKKTDRDTQMGFMVNTFHELVQKLKDKEKELHELRRRAEERADHIESYNENILQSVPSGVVSFDGDLRVTSMNASAERILGVEADISVGKHYHKIFNEQISELIRDNQALERVEVLHESPLKKRIWLGLNISPLKDKDGMPIGRIMVFTDLTDLKALESQMKLRESLSNLGEMSAGIAHELRNPMGVIAGYTKLLSKKVPEDLRNSVEAIDKEIRMMDRIISDFMSFTHPPNLNKSSFDISLMLEEITHKLLPEDKKIDTDLSLVQCLLEGDETLLRQVFTNLIQNSIDAMVDGGKLIIKLEKTNSLINIAIRDKGHGISDDIKDKVFLPFYTTKEKGTGLGLAIVHKIVVSHAGNITFESSPEGTTFNITLFCK